MLTSRMEGYELLGNLDAPDRLIRHARYVSDAADSLLIEFGNLRIPLNALLVELGAVLHDAGKIIHPEELAQSGSLHETAGETLLVTRGVQAEVARCCRSHGAWSVSGVSLEERIVALADKLWKGKREADLELLVIDEAATRLGASRWDIFERMDSVFEEIAAGGFERVELSRQENQ